MLEKHRKSWQVSAEMSNYEKQKNTARWMGVKITGGHFICSWFIALFNDKWNSASLELHLNSFPPSLLSHVTLTFSVNYCSRTVLRISKLCASNNFFLLRKKKGKKYLSRKSRKSVEGNEYRTVKFIGSSQRYMTKHRRWKPEGKNYISSSQH